MFWTAVVFTLIAAPPIAAGVQSAASPSAEERELIALTDQWANAEIKHAEAMLHRMVDDRFLFITSSGRAIDGKTAYIEAVRKFNFTSVPDGGFARVLTIPRLWLASSRRTARAGQTAHLGKLPSLM